MIGKFIKRLSSRKSSHTYKDEVSAFDELGPGDVAIDCGANVGNVTARMASKGATVYAFEPNPYAYQVLKERFLGVSNVHCLNKGVLDRDDTMQLYLHENAHEDQVKWSTGSSLLKNKGNINQNSCVEIEVIDLARFIKELDMEIKVLKMDVEGVECLIINKLIDSHLIDKIKFLIAETHEKKNPPLKEETDRLRKRIEEEKLTNVELKWK
jgi:FkbM family methyltransferase